MMSAPIGDWRSANGMSYQDAKARIERNQANGMSESNGSYDQATYLRELNEKVNATVISGAWDGSSPFGSNSGYTVMIHPEFLQMMHGDSELGAYYEEQINILAEEGAKFKQSEEAKGNIIHSQGSYINEKGEISSYCSYTMTSEGGGGSVTTEKTTKSAKEVMEELQKKLEEKKQQEKLEEKREEKKALLESLSASAAVTVTRVPGDDEPDTAAQ